MSLFYNENETFKEEFIPHLDWIFLQKNKPFKANYVPKQKYIEKILDPLDSVFDIIELNPFVKELSKIIKIKRNAPVILFLGSDKIIDAINKDGSILPLGGKRWMAYMEDMYKKVDFNAIKKYGKNIQPMSYLYTELLFNDRLKEMFITNRKRLNEAARKRSKGYKLAPFGSKIRSMR